MSYRIICAGGAGEIEVKKSRFIANTHPVSSEEEAQEFLASIRRQYYDARHNCYAYTIGSRFELQRSSDDGEPSGTAGRPILELLLKEEIHDCIIVVTRYFGGTLLGTGGLIRAYQGAAREGLANSTLTDRCAGRKYTIRADYRLIGKIQFLEAEYQIPVTDIRYTDVVETDIIVPDEREGAFLAALAEATDAGAGIIRGEPVDFALPGGRLILFDTKASASGL